MSLMCDHEIREWSLAPSKMIEPFSEPVSENGVISYGLTSYGYDLRLGTKFKVFDSWLRMHKGVINPKSTEWHKCVTDMEVKLGEAITIPPNSFCLAESMEVFTIPRHILVIVMGKSTYARCGIIVNVTPGEPEWRGKWTMEISNTTPLPAMVFAGEGIAQAIFLKNSPVCEVSYADKRGKYQGQSGLMMPLVKDCPETKAE